MSSDVTTTHPTRGRLTALCSAPTGALKSQVSKLRDQRREGEAQAKTRKVQRGHRCENRPRSRRRLASFRTLPTTRGWRSIQSQRWGKRLRQEAPSNQVHETNDEPQRVEQSMPQASVQEARTDISRRVRETRWDAARETIREVLKQMRASSWQPRDTVNFF
jgi:hypothetical protein